VRPSFFKVEFNWPVASRGHRLVKTEIADAVEPRELFSVVTANKGRVLKRRAFDEFPGLFKEFAKIEPSAAGALAFADKYGLLQNDRENELIWWFQYRNDFAELIALKDRARLHEKMGAALPLNPAVLLELAQQGLETWLPDSQLSALERVNRIFQTGITAQITWGTRAPGILVQPKSLLAAMALQLGLWLGTEAEYIRQCPECGGTFEYGPGTTHRASRRYCSLECQEAARYARRRRRMLKGTADEPH
jgi:hypothetical protein